MEKGLVLRSTGSWYEILGEDHKVIKGRLRGIFKNKGMKVTNPIAVGDYVSYQFEKTEEDTAVITKIHDRENYIIRKSTRKKFHGHIIASNIDQAMLLVTLKSPKTSFGFIDRFLVAAESYDIPVTLIINKMDIYQEEELKLLAYLQEVYEDLGYSVISISVVENKGIDFVKEKLKNKKTLLSGHSGVGKSSLLNTLHPNLEIKTNEVSAYADKGKHTTTFAEMHQLEDNAFVIDTPGIKELGIMNLEENEIGFYFREIKKYGENCKFYNCSHTHEPDCNVMKMVNDGNISYDRYKSYLSILENEDNRR